MLVGAVGRRAALRADKRVAFFAGGGARFRGDALRGGGAGEQRDGGEQTDATEYEWQWAGWHVNSVCGTGPFFNARDPSAKRQAAVVGLLRLAQGPPAGASPFAAESHALASLTKSPPHP